MGGRGDLRDWEIVNRPAKGFTPSNCFFALRTEPADGRTATRAIEGPLDAALYEGSSGSPTPNHGLPRFRNASFSAAYPLAQVLLSDPDVPLSVRLEAFNPLIPPDEERSGLPVAVLRYVLRNDGSEAVKASICGSLQNFIGDDGMNALASKGRNSFVAGAHATGLLLESDGVDREAEPWGTMALSVLGSPGTTHRLAWPERSWGGTLLDFWDDFSGDGRLDSKAQEEGDNRPIASLATSVEVPAGGEASITFLITWHFPNRQSWSPNDTEIWTNAGACQVGPPTVGNWYCHQFEDAWAVAEHVAGNLAELETDTVGFVKAICDADLPNAVKEAALYNVSTLRTQTVFRAPDGKLFGWEGCHDREGSCLGSCTHVWNYETTTPYLFGKLNRTLRDVEFEWGTKADTGHMAFRVHLPLSLASTNNGLAAADGQMGCLMKLYRDWKLCGDDEWLKRLWPNAKKSMEFCWIPGGWDADRDGVMEGCQHNTMDVEYYGPNPQMGSWYLGALRATEEMARHLGESEFADECRRLFKSGSRFMDDELFNGEYYEHKIVPPTGEIAKGIRHEGMGARDLSDPEFQLGAGCLIDQLVGQYMAHVCVLGYLLEPAKVKKTLQSILEHNRRANLWGHFNQMRSYALGGETAVLMASYPHGNRPKRPFPYCTEVMTGFEHQLGAHLIYEGMTEEGVQVVADVRERYDGKRRSPFDEAECGHHYARAMAAWSNILALTGFQYDGHSRAIRFALPLGVQKVFWSTGDAWGTLDGDRLAVGGGEVRLSSVEVQGRGVATVSPGCLKKGDAADLVYGSP